MSGSEAGSCATAKPKHDWPAIERAYRDGKLTLSKIEERFGVNRRSLYNRLSREGWPRRRPDRKGGRSKAEQMLSRLKHIAERRIEEIEAGAGASAKRRSAADLDRETRSLSSLLKLMGQIVQLEAAARNGRSGPGRWTPAYRDQRRAELARKLLAMLEQERGAPLPDGA